MAETAAATTGSAEYAHLFSPDSKVTPERIDQGVDYSGTGTLQAIARGVVTQVVPEGTSGWPGNFIEYQITDPSSELYGQYLYYAEGVKPRSNIKPGTVVDPGDPIADLIPGWKTGIEVGLGSGTGTTTYAMQNGGFDGTHSTPAGIAFSDLVTELGDPGGVLQPPPGTGTVPAGVQQMIGNHTQPDNGSSSAAVILDPFTGVTSGIASGISDVAGAVGDAASSVAGAVGGAASSVAGAASTGVDTLGAIADFVSNPVPALLTIAFVLGGALLIYEGAGRMLGVDAPIKQAAQQAAVTRMAIE
jgi:hypothetical protein